MNKEIKYSKNLPETKKIMQTYSKESYNKYLLGEIKIIEFYRNNDMANIWQEIQKFSNKNKNN